jgi:hypothetical protein
MVLLAEEPTIRDGEAATGHATDLWDLPAIVGAAYTSQRYVENWNAQTVAMEEAYDRRNDAIFQAMGRAPQNPFRSQMAEGGDIPWPIGIVRRRNRPFYDFEDMQPRLQRYQTELADLEKERPDLAHIIRSGESPHEDALKTRNAADDGIKQALALYHGPAGTGTFASLLGGFAGSFNDPLNDALLLLGPTSRAGAGLKALVWTGVKQAGVNAAGAALAQPQTAIWRREAGLTVPALGYDFNDFLANVGTAGAFGFGAEVGVRGSLRAYHAVRGHVPLLDETGAITGWDTPAGAMEKAARASSMERLRAAAEGDPAALREMAEHTGAIHDPVLRSTLDMLDDVEATSTRRPGVDPHASDWADAQALRSLVDDDEPPPVAPRPEPLVAYRIVEAPPPPPGFEEAMAARRAGRNRVAEAPPPPAAASAPAAPVDVYRVGETARGPWYTTDYERAARAAADAGQPVERVLVPPERMADLKRVMGEHDFVLPEDLHGTRAEVAPEVGAARAALASGELDAVGAAKILTDIKEALDASVPRGSDTMQMAIAISRLSEQARDMVLQGEASPEWGALVQRLVEDPARQAGILADVMKAKPVFQFQARKLIKQLLAASEPGEAPAPARGLSDPYGGEAHAQVDGLADLMHVKLELPEARGHANVAKGEPVGLGREGSTVEAVYDGAKAYVRLEGRRDAVIVGLDAAPPREGDAFGNVMLTTPEGEAAARAVADAERARALDRVDRRGREIARAEGARERHPQGVFKGTLRDSDLPGGHIPRETVGGEMPALPEAEQANTSSMRMARAIAGADHGGIGTGEMTLLVRSLASEADERGVRLRALLPEPDPAKPQFMHPTTARGILRLYGFKGEGNEMVRAPKRARAAGGWQNVSAGTVPHPDHPHLNLPVDRDGLVHFFRGEHPGQQMGENTHRIFTTDRARAEAHAGADGVVHEVALPASRLKEAAPRASGASGDVRPNQRVFTLSRRAASEARTPDELRDLVEGHALDHVPEADLVSGLDEADGIDRLAELIRDCKL